MKFLKISLVIITGLLPVFALTQDMPFYSNYTVNPLVYNPASAGQGEDVQTFLHHRTQWTGFQGSPVVNMLTISAPLPIFNSGLGIAIQNDQHGLFNNLSGSFKYAYHARLNQKSILSLGLGMDIQNRLLRIGESTVRDIDDPLMINGSTSETFFDGSFGVQYHIVNKFFIGGSVAQLLEGKDAREYTLINNTRYFIGQASYLFTLSSLYNMKFEPVLLTRYINNQDLQYDVSGLFHYKNMFMVGVGYRNDYAINFHAGISLKNVTFRYVYDFATVNENLNAGLSHELAIGYTLKVNHQKKVTNRFPQVELKKNEETLSPDKIRTILFLLIDEYFESGSKSEEDVKRTALLKDTILKLLDNLNELNKN